VTVYEPLCEMTTTGDAYLADDGVLMDSGEYVAALYESYQADRDCNEAWEMYIAGQGPCDEYAYQKYAWYANRAEALTEEIFKASIEGVAELIYEQWNGS
jgi:hypothetical protein